MQDQALGEIGRNFVAEFESISSKELKLALLEILETMLRDQRAAASVAQD